jgi:acetyl-CoA carboxylase biotin carboxyl carrier protein
LDIKEIKAIVEMMKRADLTEFEIEEEHFKLRIARGAREEAPAFVSHPALPAYQATSLPPTTPAGGNTNPPIPAQEAPKEIVAPANDTRTINSPMVGTFYRTPSPENPPFVQPGSKVVETTPVCIIEAMKVMNEIQAEIKGEIVEVLVESGASVEYGQPLFRIKTA